MGSVNALHPLTLSLPWGKVVIFKGAMQHSLFQELFAHGALRHAKMQPISCSLQQNESLFNRLDIQKFNSSTWSLCGKTVQMLRQYGYIKEYYE